MAKEKKGKIITITSMKGGVGKTTTTLLLASVYKNMKKKVLIVDLDLYTGSIAFSLNLDVKSTVFNICDDMANNRYKGLFNGEYITSFDEYIDVLPAPKDPRQASKVDTKCLEILMNSLANYYDVVLIDTNHLLDIYNMIAFEYSDNIVNIFTNDAYDLKGTKNIVAICKNMNVKNLLLVLNNAADDRKRYFSIYDMKSILKHPIDYIIPNSLYIKNFDMYVMESKLIDYFSKLRNLKKDVEKLALRLLDNVEGVGDNEEK